jgi:integrase
MQNDGIYRRKYRDKVTGEEKLSRFLWLKTDPVTKRRISTGKTTRRGALEFKAERERLAANPDYQAANETTIESIAKELVKNKQRSRAAGTVSFYVKKIGHVLRLFGTHSPMSVIEPKSVDRYVSTRIEEGAAMNTVSKEITVIQQLCKVAKRRGCYHRDISTLKPLDFSSGYKPRKRVLTLEEQEAIEAKCTPEQFAAVALLISLGVRESEAGNVHPEDYDKELGIVHVRGTKTEGADRFVPVLGMFRELFEKALPYLPLKVAKPSQLVRKAAARAKVPHTTANDLRRTLATRMVVAGVPYSIAAQIMGHADSRMLERVYGKPTPSDIARMAAPWTGAGVGTGKAQPSPDCAPKSNETACPGAELNCRHEDFQACPSDEKDENSEKNGGRISQKPRVYPRGVTESGTVSAQLKRFGFAQLAASLGIQEAA